MKCPYCNHKITIGLKSKTECDNCGGSFKSGIDFKKMALLSVIVLTMHFFIAIPILYVLGLEDLPVIGVWVVMVYFMSLRLEKT